MTKREVAAQVEALFIITRDRTQTISARRKAQCEIQKLTIKSDITRTNGRGSYITEQARKVYER